MILCTTSREGLSNTHERLRSARGSFSSITPVSMRKISWAIYAKVKYVDNLDHQATRWTARPAATYAYAVLCHADQRHDDDAFSSPPTNHPSLKRPLGLRIILHPPTTSRDVKTPTLLLLFTGCRRVQEDSIRPRLVFCMNVTDASKPGRLEPASWTSVSSS